MKTWFVSRHQGAIDWIKEQNIPIDHFITHLDPDTQLTSGDTVIGSLPIPMVFELNNKGVRFINLDLTIPAHWRGLELSKAHLTKLKAQLHEYHVESKGKVLST